MQQKIISKKGGQTTSGTFDGKKCRQKIQFFYKKYLKLENQQIRNRVFISVFNRKSTHLHDRT